MNAMNSYFLSFSTIIYNLKKKDGDQVISRDLVDKLDSINEGIQNCGRKMFSATKFIDYFVHDILDYTILNKQEKNFTKNNTILDIRQVIDEILDIMEDKIAMMEIEVAPFYRHFDDNYLLKTDFKRL